MSQLYCVCCEKFIDNKEGIDMDLKEKGYVCELCTLKEVEKYGKG